MYTVLIVILVLMLLGGLPTWGWHNYGYYPAGGAGFLLLIVLIVLIVRGG